MAVVRDQPYSNANFAVYLGLDDSRSVPMGFAEVIFPPFTVDGIEWTQDEAAAIQGTEITKVAIEKHIILRRGFTGSLDLYNWWKKANRGKAPKLRALKIELLSEDHSTAVLTWRFRNVRPVSLFYSPLRAIEGGILMETVVLTFDGVDVS